MNQLKLEMRTHVRTSLNELMTELNTLIGIKTYPVDTPIGALLANPNVQEVLQRHRYRISFVRYPRMMDGYLQRNTRMRDVNSQEILCIELDATESTFLNSIRRRLENTPIQRTSRGSSLRQAKLTQLLHP